MQLDKARLMTCCVLRNSCPYCVTWQDMQLLACIEYSTSRFVHRIQYKQAGMLPQAWRALPGSLIRIAEAETLTAFT